MDYQLWFHGIYIMELIILMVIWLNLFETIFMDWWMV
jgi:hypothetical protein